MAKLFECFLKFKLFREPTKKVGIGSLPDEILIFVFEYLDPKSTKQAALVCQNWNHLISTAPSVMAKFNLKINVNGMLPVKFDEILDLNRRHVSMELQHTSGICIQLHQQLVEILVEKFGSTLRCLKVKQKGHLDRKTLSIMFINTPKLEKLELDHVNFLPVDKSMQSAPVMLEKLKTIVSFESDWKIFDLIEAPGLKALQLCNHKKNYSISLLENFLNSTPKLEIADFSFDFFNDMTPNFPFKLKKIKGGNITKFNENCQQFLLSQSATVESIQIFTDLADVNKFILQNFKNLEFLDLKLKSMSAESKEFFDELLPFPRMREINANSFTNSFVTKGLLSKCPGLVKVKAGDGICNFMLVELADYARNLEELELLTILRVVPHFKFLKSLRLNFVFDTESFVKFLRVNSTLETLEISNIFVDDLTDEVLSSLANIKNVIVECHKSRMKKFKE